MKHTNKFYRDFLVTGEKFQLIPNKKYTGLLHTYPTPDAHSLAKYYESEEYISHTDKSTGLLNQIYYQIRQYNFYKKYKLIQQKSPGIKVLDYGCGTGEFVNYLNKKNINAFGFEPNPSAYEIATKKNKNIIFSSNLFLEHEKFDVITLWHVLEHIPDMFKVLERIKNALNPGGKIFIAVPNYESFDAQFYKEFWAAYDVPRHLWHFNQKSISAIMNDFGMIIESIYPMIFDAYYVSMLSEKYKRSSLSLFRAFLVGSVSNLKAVQNGQYSSLIYEIRIK